MPEKKEPEGPKYAPEVLRMRAACQHMLTLLDNYQPLQAWREGVARAWEEIQEAGTHIPRAEELEEPEDEK